MPDNRLARKFLHRVWSEQLAAAPDNEAIHAFLAQKGADASWSDKPLTASGAGDHINLRLPSDTTNLYYTPNLFTQSRRLKRFVNGGCWLYADLDEVDPNTLDGDEHGLLGLTPTLAIESSPGRYQGLWLLDRWLNVRRLAELNQQLTYYTGSDPGNWKMTQVLRVPGTVSTKHGDPWEVRLLWARPHSLRYSPSSIRAIVGDAETPQSASNAQELKLPRASAQRLLRRYASRLPTEAKKLARTKTVLGSEDRSSRLWRLECLLLEAGMSPAEAFVVIKPTPWNKWADTRDGGTAQLWTEINKAAVHVETSTRNTRGSKSESGSTKSRSRSPHSKSSSQTRSSTGGNSETGSASPKRPRKKKTPPDHSRTLTSLNDFLLTRLPKPSWLVQGVWSNTAHGLLAGEAKTYKSLLMMDLAVSVASATPFLNRFPVAKAGPVILIQEENDPVDMHDRLMRITASRGFAPRAHTANGRLHFDTGERLPVSMLNRQGFHLNDEKDLEYLNKWASQIKPALIALDPLYLMTPGLNTNEASDMTPVLENLLRIKQAHDCGILLVHHFRKTHKDERTQRAASRIAGTSVFHRWLASAIYIDPTEIDGTVYVSSEHRSFKSNDSFYLSFDLGSDDDVHYEPTLRDAVDISDNGKEDRTSSFIDDEEEHDGPWVRANEDLIMLWLDDNLGDEFFIYKASKALKLMNAKLLYEILNKYGFTFKKKRVPNTDTTRLYVYAPKR